MWSIGFKIRSLLCLCEKQIVWLMCFFVVIDELCLFELFLFLLLVLILALASCSYIGFFGQNQWHPTTHHPTSNDTSLGGILQDCYLVRLVKDQFYIQFDEIEDRYDMMMMMMMPPKFFEPCSHWIGLSLPGQTAWAAKVLKIRIPEFLRRDATTLKVWQEGYATTPKVQEGFMVFNVAVAKLKCGIRGMSLYKVYT